MPAEAPRRCWGALLLGGALLMAGCASLPPTSRQTLRWGGSSAQALAAPFTQSPPLSAGSARPEGWPDYSSSDEALMSPFLASASPAEFIALQRGVDMPRLVAALEDWSAVRLGALGPLGAEASQALQRKRAAFLLTATEQYGAYAQVFALFILHSSFDDEVRQLLRMLAREKQLGQTLGQMEAVREELERRGLKLSDLAERNEQSKDVLRGLGRAARDALSTRPMSDGARYMNMSAMRAHLPPAYQQALDEVERAIRQQHFSTENVVLGSFDHLTFGVPLGFYHLVAGTRHGGASLFQGQYEQATRELAPAGLLVALYAGGKSVRSGGVATRGRGVAEGATSVAPGFPRAAHRNLRGGGQAGPARRAVRGCARHRAESAFWPATSRGELQLQEPRLQLGAGRETLDGPDGSGRECSPVVLRRDLEHPPALSQIPWPSGAGPAGSSCLRRR